MSSAGVPFGSNLVQLVSPSSSIRLANFMPVEKTLVMSSFDFPYCLPLGSHRPILLLSNLIKTDSQLVFVLLPLPLQRSCPKKQAEELLIFVRRLPS
jgi:hypothetical protein